MKWIKLKDEQPNNITQPNAWIDVRVRDYKSMLGYVTKRARWDGSRFLPACCMGSKECCNDKYGSGVMEWLDESRNSNSFGQVQGKRLSTSPY